MTAAEIIATLGMQKHPEGGWYAETFRDTAEVEGRACSTAIYYLLERGERSHWHRVDAVETWHFYAGAPLELSISPDGKWTELMVLGGNVLSGEVPQIIVRKNEWQSAQSTGDWTLVGCTVAPGFQFEGFELAPEDWEPGV